MAGADEPAEVLAADVGRIGTDMTEVRVQNRTAEAPFVPQRKARAVLEVNREPVPPRRLAHGSSTILPAIPKMQSERRAIAGLEPQELAPPVRGRELVTDERVLDLSRSVGAADVGVVVVDEGNPPAEDPFEGLAGAFGLGQFGHHSSLDGCAVHHLGSVQEPAPCENRDALAELTITDYTDPGCPCAWSAEPYRRRLQWLYGDPLEWQVRMVVLADDGSVYEDKGFTAERMSDSFRNLGARYHMPIDTSLRPRMAGTIPACRAVVAVRRHRPELEAALLRALRVLHFAGEAARRAVHAARPPSASGWTPPTSRPGWPSRDRALLARTSPRRATPRRRAGAGPQLAPSEGGRRYTCPSYEIVRARQATAGRVVPGFQPFAAYEVAVANVAPDASRREDPADVLELLDWAGEPLATREVAVVCEIGHDRRPRAARPRRRRGHLGFDGLWHLDGVVAVA